MTFFLHHGGCHVLSDHAPTIIQHTPLSPYTPLFSIVVPFVNEKYKPEIHA